jgi:hypothetical protein
MLGILKKTWSLLNEVLHKSKNKQQISSVVSNGSMISDPTLIANTFNEFFTTIADEIASLINPVQNHTTVTTPESEDDPPDENDIPNLFNMSDIPLTDGEIIASINNIEDKKTDDMSGFSTHIFKKSFYSILTPIRHIFGRSLATGIVPSKLKIAKVIPIYKAGDASDVNNYRSISLLSTYSKVLKKIVQVRLVAFLDANNLITPQQFGFRSHHSTSHPMTLLLNKVTSALNDKKHSIIIFCDLKKAFDTCNHQILLNKLHKLGIRRTELLWFKSYLSDRQQFVSINDQDSLL